MKNRLKLKSYIVVAFTAFSTLIALIISITAIVIMEKSEDRLIRNTIMQEAEMLSDYYTKYPEALRLHGNYFKLFITGPGQQDVLPLEISGFKNKIEEVIIDGIEHVLIHVDKSPYNFYFLYNFSDFEEFESSVELVLLSYVLIALIIGLWIGVYASGKVIKPIRRLADSLEQQGDEHGLAQIPCDFVNDEVGILANRFADYNKKLAGYIEREKAFTSNASHELRTPVSVIAGAAELLEDSTTLSEADRKIVMRIQHEVHVMRDLINALLAVSRGGDQYKEQIDVNALMQKNLDEQAEQAGMKNIQVQYIEDSQLTVNGNRQALDIILRNLLANAIQYTNNGIIRVIVKSKSLCIEDSGPGIPENIKDSVFERFFRGQKELTCDNLGVGLALVKQLCEANRWIITLNSGRNNIGTEVSLNF